MADPTPIKMKRHTIDEADFLRKLGIDPARWQIDYLRALQGGPVLIDVKVREQG